MLSALPVFHVSGLLGFRWHLLRRRAIRDFIADTRRFSLALGYEHSKTTEGCAGINPSTTAQGGALWIDGMVQRHLRMTVSNPAHRQYIRKGLGGMGYIRRL
jgi:hypothetical protein